MSSIDTTNSRSIVAITRAGAPIIGLYNTIAVRSTVGSKDIFPFSQGLFVATDGLIETKYVNLGFSDDIAGRSLEVYDAGIATGFYIIPNISNTSVARGLLFAIAHDSPNRRVESYR
jgi:hypothetical protein